LTGYISERNHNTKRQQTHLQTMAPFTIGCNCRKTREISSLGTDL